MRMVSTGSNATRLSLAVVIGLVALKVAVGIITGSLSVIAQAADSFLDLFAVSITLFALRFATRPADGEHPFGHGKMENLAAITQALLIFAAGGAVIYAAIQRIIAGATLVLAEAGIAVMLVSIIASIWLSRHLLKVAREIDSVALQANARNIATDVYSAAAVLAGLAAVRLTGIAIIDPIIALLVSLFILKVAYDVLRRSFGGLIDVKLPEDEESTIKASITEHAGELVDFHKLRTRKAGNQRYIDLHLIMPRDTGLEEAHRMCDHLEQDIRQRLPRTDVTIHVEPCDDKCQWCGFTCDSRKKDG